MPQNTRPQKRFDLDLTVQHDPIELDVSSVDWLTVSRLQDAAEMIFRDQGNDAIPLGRGFWPVHETDRIWVQNEASNKTNAELTLVWGRVPTASGTAAVASVVEIGVWSGGDIPVADPIQVETSTPDADLTDHSLQVSQADTSEVLVPENADRRYLMIANPDPNEEIWLAWGQAAVDGGAGSFVLTAQSGILFEAPVIPDDELQVLANTQGHAVTAYEGV